MFLRKRTLERTPKQRAQSEEGQNTISVLSREDITNVDDKITGAMDRFWAARDDLAEGTEAGQTDLRLMLGGYLKKIEM